MVAWKVVGQEIGVTSISSQDTSARHPLGKRVKAQDTQSSYGEGEFIYLAGVASCEQYDWCTYNLDNGSATRLVADAIGPVCIAQTACTASYYGWFQIHGKAIGQCLTQFADNGKVFITATAGAVDDTSVAGDWVNLAKGASATVADSGVADFEIEYPYVDNISSST